MQVIEPRPFRAARWRQSRLGLDCCPFVSIIRRQESLILSIFTRFAVFQVLQVFHPDNRG